MSSQRDHLCEKASGSAAQLAGASKEERMSTRTNGIIGIRFTLTGSGRKLQDVTYQTSWSNGTAAQFTLLDDTATVMS
jgi:hypothetical protein